MNLRSLQSFSPWIQGLFGGAGVTLIWETILRPARARRAVAKVLAEEVSIALDYCALQRLQLEKDSTTLPADFQICANAFDALADQLGELPARDVGAVVLFYHQAKVLNGMPIGYGAAVIRWQGLPTSHDSAERRALKGEWERYLVVYRIGLEKMVERSRELLPRLRRISLPFWRLDRFRKVKPLSETSLVARIDALRSDLDR